MNRTTRRAAVVSALIAALSATLILVTAPSANAGPATVHRPTGTAPPTLPVKTLPASSPAPSPTGGCTQANYVCLYDGTGLTGQYIAVRPAERGGCIDLGPLGWAGRAKSAKNTFAREAVTYPNQDCTGRPDGIAGNSVKNTLLYSPGSIWVFNACTYSSTLCLYDRVDFNGAEFTVSALNPSVGTCVDLVSHGWGSRAVSAVNTNTASAVLYTGPNCTGSTLTVSGSSWDRAFTFPAASVFVH